MLEPTLPKLLDGYYWHVGASIFGEKISIRKRLFWKFYKTVKSMIPLSRGTPVENLEWGANKLHEELLMSIRDEAQRTQLRYGTYE